MSARQAAPLTQIKGIGKLFAALGNCLPAASVFGRIKSLFRGLGSLFWRIDSLFGFDREFAYNVLGSRRELTRAIAESAPKAKKSLLFSLFSRIPKETPNAQTA
jgi:hypothetical protein